MVTNIVTLQALARIASEWLSFALKIGVLVGGGCCLFYFHSIEYFPSDLTVGSIALFALVAASFVIVYFIFISSLASVGICVLWLLKPIYKVVRRIKKASKNEPSKQFAFITPGFVIVPLALVGLLIVILMNSQESEVWYRLVATSVLLGILVTTYNGIAIRSGWFPFSNTSRIIQARVSSTNPNGSLERDQKAKCLILVVIIVLPLFYAGVSGALVQDSVRFVGIQRMPSEVFVMPPYDSLLPSVLSTGHKLGKSGSQGFCNIAIMFSAPESDTVLRYPMAPGGYRFIVIPSSSVSAEVGANNSMQRTQTRCAGSRR